MAAYSKPFVRTQSLKIDGVEVTATAAELNAAATGALSPETVEYTATGAIPATVQNIEINHTATIAAMTIADFADHSGLVTIKDTSASGTIAHTVTLASGTFDGTNDVVTLNAPNEFIAIWVDSAGNGTIVENVGEVALS
jgi:hypothetical protein